MIERRPFLDLLSHILLIFGALVALLPLWATLVVSTHSQQDLIEGGTPLWFGSEGLSVYARLLIDGPASGPTAPMAQLLANTAIAAAIVTAAKLVLALATAYAIVFFRFPLRMLAFWVVLLTLMLPVEVRLLPTAAIADDVLLPLREGWATLAAFQGSDVTVSVPRISLLESPAGLALPLIASAVAALLFRQLFLTVPDDLVEAAKIDKAGSWRFFRDILLPMSRVQIAALALVLFVHAWGMHAWPLVAARTPEAATLSVGLAQALNTGAVPMWPEVAAMAVIALLPPAVLVLSLNWLGRRALTRRRR
ncbi:MAG: ABC transporter permease subunit [Pikeienuella sp.]